jgi:hypothetical protein
MTAALALSSENPMPETAPVLRLAGEAGAEGGADFGGGSISVAEAAALLPAEDGGVGMRCNAVRLRCERTWGPAALARKVDGEWRISREAEPHFRQYPRGQEIVADSRDLTEKQRAKLMRKKAVLQVYGEAMQQTRGCQAEAIRMTLPRAKEIFGAEIHERTIRKWIKLHRSGGDEALVDGRTRRTGCRRDRRDDPYLNFVADLWLDVRQLKLTQCIKMAQGKAGEKGWQVWGDGVVRRFIAAIPPVTRILRREGKEAFQNKCEPYIERTYETLKTNGLWCFDTHTLDILCVVGKRVNPVTGEETPIYARPFLSAWMDMRSRVIVGWTIRAESPTAETVAECLANGCRVYGVPEGAYFDNGKAESARVLTGESKAEKRRRLRTNIDVGQLLGIYAMLGMTYIQAWLYHGMSKTIERAFGRICDQFSRTFKTYCGKDTVSKPEGLEDRLHLAPTLEEVREKFAAWLEHDYHQTIHQGNGMGVTPMEAWRANLMEKRTAPADVLELLLWPRYGPFKIGQNGIGHKGVWYGQSELACHFGKQAYIRVNPNDVTMVRVYDAQDKILCAARANRRLPANATAADLREAIREKKRISKAMKDSARQRLRVHYDTTDLLIEAAIARNKAAAALPKKPGPDAPPAVLKAVRPDIAEELARVPLKAEKLRSLPKPISIDEALAAFAIDPEEREERLARSRFMYQGKPAEPEIARPKLFLERARRREELDLLLEAERQDLPPKSKPLSILDLVKDDADEAPEHTAGGEAA